MSNFALVLNSSKQPLDPVRPGAARRLLKAGKAVVPPRVETTGFPDLPLLSYENIEISITAKQSTT